MERLIGAFATIGEAKVRSDDDFVDRLHHRYTTLLLIVFAIVVSTKQYVGEPINCWCPAQFTDNHEDFTNKICWVTNTYYVPISQKKIPEESENQAKIGYYQWVPLILLVQGVTFYIPCMIWRLMNNKSGINVNNIVETAVTLQHGAYHENREKNIQFMVKHFDQTLGCQRDHKKHCCGYLVNFIGKFMIMCGKRHGNYILVLYIFCKILFFLNVVGQLFLLDAFLGTKYHVYGYDILRKIANDEEWAASEVFPRVTLCDFHVRTLGNIHKHTVQCVLPINLFNEKIYIFLWFWFVFAALAIFLNLGTWIYRSCVKSDHVRYVKHHLVAMDSFQSKPLQEEDKKRIAYFTKNYLRQDGILVLRLVGINTNELIVAELLKELYRNYQNNLHLQRNGKKNGKEPSAPLMHHNEEI